MTTTAPSAVAATFPSLAGADGATFPTTAPSLPCSGLNTLERGGTGSGAPTRACRDSADGPVEDGGAPEQLCGGTVAAEYMSRLPDQVLDLLTRSRHVRDALMDIVCVLDRRPVHEDD